MTDVKPNGRLVNGRPTKLTQDTIDRIVEVLTIGATYEMAAHHAGISYATFALWMAEARKIIQLNFEAEESGEPRNLTVKEKAREQRYLKFFDAVNGAKYTLGVEALKTIYDAALRDPNWAAWYLRTKFPEEFGKPAQVEVNTTGTVEHTGRVEHQVITDPNELSQILTILRDAGALGDALAGSDSRPLDTADSETQ